MAFTVEDGTGVEGANAFITVAFYKSYWTDRGISVKETDTQIQAAIVRATDYIEKRFGTQYKGERATLTQTLSFPRSDVVIDGITLPDDALPAQLLAATAEYARRARKYAELAPDKPVSFDRESVDGDTISGTGLVVEKEEQVGPLSERTVYVDPTTSTTSPSMPAYPGADLLMAPLLRSGGRGRTIRA